MFVRKYGHDFMPRYIKRLIKNSVPALTKESGSDCKKIFLHLNSLSLARFTWRVYGVVLKWYRACCQELNIWACCCLGYFGSFRMGELLSKSKSEFDQVSYLI